MPRAPAAWKPDLSRGVSAGASADLFGTRQPIRVTRRAALTIGRPRRLPSVAEPRTTEPPTFLADPPVLSPTTQLRPKARGRDVGLRTTTWTAGPASHLPSVPGDAEPGFLFITGEGRTEAWYRSLRVSSSAPTSAEPAGFSRRRGGGCVLVSALMALVGSCCFQMPG